MHENESRIPPQDLLAERAVLGAAMLSAEAVAETVAILRPAHFYQASHRIIWAAICELAGASDAVDVVTVRGVLDRDDKLGKVGGVAALLELTEGAISPGNAVYHARIVRDKAMLRGLLKLSHEITRTAYRSDAPASELLNRIEAKVFALGKSQMEGGEVQHISKVVPGACAELVQEGRKVKFGGVPTGYYDLDALLGGGIRNGEFILIAGRPSMGKTTLALNILRKACIYQHKGGLLFSLEMSRQSIVQHLICACASVNVKAARQGEITDRERAFISEASTAISEASILIDDTAGQDVMQIRSKARAAVRGGNVHFIVLDYLQLLSASGRYDSRQQEVSTISRVLKNLARELDVPLLVVSQLSRAPEARRNRRPILSDLRESGTLEQDADVVLMVFREDYYRELNRDEKSTDSLVDVIVAKNRQGPTGVAQLVFLRDKLRFENMARGGI